MKLRILNVVRFPVGGIRSYLRYTYSRFSPDAYSATIVTVDLPEARLLPAGLAPLEVDLRLVPERQALLRLAWETSRTLRHGHFDLVHSQGTTAALAVALSAKWSGLPHVVTLHETFREEQFGGTGIKRRVLSQLFRSLDGVVTVTEDARDNLFQYIPFDADASRRVHVMRNGVGIDMALAEAETTRPHLRANPAISSDAKLIGYVGRFMPEKGFDVLLDAVRQIHQRKTSVPKFMIVAVNDGSYVREYRQQISEWGLEPYFFFAGFQKSAAGTLAELDAVVMPSRREACGMVAMEAMVLGCPLIASDCIGLRELTAGTPALTTTAGDPASLARALEDFLSRPAGYTEQARAYVPAARASFDSTKTTESLIALFSEVIQTRHSNRSRG